MSSMLKIYRMLHKVTANEKVLKKAGFRSTTLPPTTNDNKMQTLQLTDTPPLSFNTVLCTVASSELSYEAQKKENNNFLRWGAVAILKTII